MYMALTEEQAKKIRGLGISVIEWKRCIRNNVNVGIYAINKAAEKAAQAWKKTKKNFTFLCHVGISS